MCQSQLYAILTQRLVHVSKQRGEGYAIVNHGLASIVNRVGARFAILFKSSANNRKVTPGVRVG